MRKPDRSLAGVARDLWGGPAETAAKKTTEKPAAPVRPAWKGVDESVDWTELLASGGSDPLAALAPAVLAGECDAYRTAIDLVQPLQDIAPLMMRYAIDVQDADTAAVRFAANIDAQEQHAEACGIALRAARDVMGLLPVTTVTVEADFADSNLRAAFDRVQLLGVRINAADPAAVVDACGVWTEGNADAHHSADQK